MIACLACSYEAADDFSFCPKCGTRLVAGPRPPVAGPLSEERKVVTTLFCDLEGFTALSEAHDHENVDTMLRTYAGCARAIVERHGGVVEKFIGDAVVAVFGFPRAHDDDAERAVLAALTIAAEVPTLEWPGDVRLAVRVGINTGETYLHTDIDPASGETFLTGDAVNTAARLQAAAPSGGVVVGRLTRRLTRHVIDYEELLAVSAKGKSEPVPAWLAKGELLHLQVELAQLHSVPMVGRDLELNHLKALLEAAVTQSTPRFALVFGEPGIGKTRLVRGLLAHADARPQEVVWCEARCPAYGDIAAFQPLAQLVRGCSGIRETDTADVVDRNLDVIIAGDDDGEWLRQRLHALLGLVAPATSMAENHLAWARFLELAARRRPLILALEDLHWADDALLEFMSQLASTVRDVPLLVIGTARSELLEERSELVAAGFERLPLRRLADLDVARLVSLLFDSETLTDEVREPILERAEGNPLYAEELVRLLLERELVFSGTDGLRLKDAARIPMPDSLQALIAARLDLLARERKALLADAAVVGPTFWAGSLLSVNGWRHAEVDAALDELSVREFISRSRPSSLLGDEEYAFWHALAHDVVYGQLPKAARARKHAAAAGWFEERAPERVEDRAHQCMAALDLAEEVRDEDVVRRLAERAVRAFVQSGDQAIGTDVVRAEQRYGRALALLDEADPETPGVTLRWAGALESLGRLREADVAYERAVEGFRQAGDERGMAVAMEKRAFAMGSLNDEEAHRLAEQAHSLVEGVEPSPETVRVEAAWVGWLLCMERRDEALGAAERAVAHAKQLGLPLPAKALGFRGWARCELGDRGGIQDFAVALDAARNQGLGRESAMVYCNMGEALAAFAGPAEGLRVHREGRDFSERRGIRQFVLWLGRAIVEDLVWAGRWDEALAEADSLAPVLEDAGDVLDLMAVRASQLFIHTERGSRDQIQTSASWFEETERGVEPEVDACCDVAMALSRLADGKSDEALKLIERFRAVPGSMAFERAWRLPAACRIALGAGSVELALRLVDGVEPALPVHQHALMTTSALLDEARGQHESAAATFAAAASDWHGFGVSYEEAQALLGQGRCLVALGRTPEAVGPLAAAREVFARLGAKPALGETDELLQRAASA